MIAYIQYLVKPIDTTSGFVILKTRSSAKACPYGRDWSALGGIAEISKPL